MILIFSNRQEPTTDIVIDWLEAFGASYYRLNSEDLLDPTVEKKIAIRDAGNWAIQIGDFTLNTQQIGVVWYRRWYAYNNLNIPFKGNLNHIHLHKYVTEEMDTLFYFMSLMLQNKPWLSNPFIAKSHNKLYTLLKAQEVGLRIPDTLVSNSRNTVQEWLYDLGQDLITKPIADPHLFAENELIFKIFSEKINFPKLHEYDKPFGPSLFQKRVMRSHEIRIFYLDGAFFATAIFGDNQHIDIKLSVSGTNPQAATMMPYQLPEDIERKLHQLMQALNLNTGSIDMIKEADGTHYFIEVNPVGQFLGYSFPCNYQLDRQVAEWLVRHDTESKVSAKQTEYIYA